MANRIQEILKRDISDAEKAKLLDEWFDQDPQGYRTSHAEWQQLEAAPAPTPTPQPTPTVQADQPQVAPTPTARRRLFDSIFGAKRFPTPTPSPGTMTTEEEREGMRSRDIVSKVRQVNVDFLGKHAQAEFKKVHTPDTKLAKVIDRFPGKDKTEKLEMFQAVAAAVPAQNAMFPRTGHDFFAMREKAEAAGQGEKFEEFMGAFVEEVDPSLPADYPFADRRESKARGELIDEVVKLKWDTPQEFSAKKVKDLRFAESVGGFTTGEMPGTFSNALGGVARVLSPELEDLPPLTPETRKALIKDFELTDLELADLEFGIKAAAFMGEMAPFLATPYLAETKAASMLNSVMNKLARAATKEGKKGKLASKLLDWLARDKFFVKQPVIDQITRLDPVIGRTLAKHTANSIIRRAAIQTGMATTMEWAPVAAFRYGLGDTRSYPLEGRSLGRLGSALAETGMMTGLGALMGGGTAKAGLWFDPKGPLSRSRVLKGTLDEGENTAAAASEVVDKVGVLTMRSLLDSRVVYKANKPKNSRGQYMSFEDWVEMTTGVRPSQAQLDAAGIKIRKRKKLTPEQKAQKKEVRTVKRDIKGLEAIYAKVAQVLDTHTGIGKAKVNLRKVLKDLGLDPEDIGDIPEGELNILTQQGKNEAIIKVHKDKEAVQKIKNTPSREKLERRLRDTLEGKRNDAATLEANFKKNAKKQVEEAEVKDVEQKLEKAEVAKEGPAQKLNTKEKKTAQAWADALDGESTTLVEDLGNADMRNPGVFEDSLMALTFTAMASARRFGTFGKTFARLFTKAFYNNQTFITDMAKKTRELLLPLAKRDVADITRVLPKRVKRLNNEYWDLIQKQKYDDAKILGDKIRVEYPELWRDIRHMQATWDNMTAFIAEQSKKYGKAVYGMEKLPARPKSLDWFDILPTWLARHQFNLQKILKLGPKLTKNSRGLVVDDLLKKFRTEGMEEFGPQFKGWEALRDYMDTALKESTSGGRYSYVGAKAATLMTKMYLGPFTAVVTLTDLGKSINRVGGESFSLSDIFSYMRDATVGFTRKGQIKGMDYGIVPANLRRFAVDFMGMSDEAADEIYEYLSKSLFIPAERAVRIGQAEILVNQVARDLKFLNKKLYKKSLEPNGKLNIQKYNQLIADYPVVMRRLSDFFDDPHARIKAGVLDDAGRKEVGIKTIMQSQPISPGDRAAYSTTVMHGLPVGKMAYTFRSFPIKAYEHLGKYVFKELMQGNPRPFISLALCSMSMGELSADIRFFLAGKGNPLAGGRPDLYEDFARRQAQNFMEVGGLGIFTDMILGVAYQEYGGFDFFGYGAGVTGSTIERIGGGVLEGIREVGGWEKVPPKSYPGARLVETGIRFTGVVPKIGPYLAFINRAAASWHKRKFSEWKRTKPPKAPPIFEHLIQLAERAVLSPGREERREFEALKKSIKTLDKAAKNMTEEQYKNRFNAIIQDAAALLKELDALEEGAKGQSFEGPVELNQLYRRRTDELARNPNGEPPVAFEAALNPPKLEYRLASRVPGGTGVFFYPETGDFISEQEVMGFFANNDPNNGGRAGRFDPNWLNRTDQEINQRVSDKMIRLGPEYRDRKAQLFQDFAELSGRGYPLITSAYRSWNAISRGARASHRMQIGEDGEQQQIIGNGAMDISYRPFDNNLADRVTWMTDPDDETTFKLQGGKADLLMDTIVMLAVKNPGFRFLIEDDHLHVEYSPQWVNGVLNAEGEREGRDTIIIQATADAEEWDLLFSEDDIQDFRDQIEAATKAEALSAQAPAADFISEEEELYKQSFPEESPQTDVTNTGASSVISLIEKLRQQSLPVIK